MNQTYVTGKGSFRIRSKWDIEKLKNGKWQVIISEIPYQIVKSKLIEKIDGLIEEKKASFNFRNKWWKWSSLLC